METKYSPKNIITFKINNIEYSLHKHIIQDISIFNAIFDLDDLTIFEIIYPISNDIVENVLDCLHNKDKIQYFEKYYTIKKCLKIILFAKYLGIDQELLYKIQRKMMVKISIKFIEQCEQIEYYHELLTLVQHINLEANRSLREINSIIDKCKKAKIIKKLKKIILFKLILIKLKYHQFYVSYNKIIITRNDLPIMLTLKKHLPNTLQNYY